MFLDSYVYGIKWYEFLWLLLHTTVLKFILQWGICQQKVLLVAEYYFIFSISVFVICLHYAFPILFAASKSTHFPVLRLTIEIFLWSISRNRIVGSFIVNFWISPVYLTAIICLRQVTYIRKEVYFSSLLIRYHIPGYHLVKVFLLTEPQCNAEESHKVRHSGWDCVWLLLFSKN